MRVVCAGHCNWDVRFRVDRLPAPDAEGRIEERTESGGGSAANVAVGLADLDHASHFLGAVGDDEHGTAALDRLEQAGVETHVRVTETETTTKYIFFDRTGEVALLGTGGANEAFTASDLSEAVLESAAAIHLTGQDPDTAAALAGAAEAASVAVSFDPGRRVTERAYTAALDHTDILFATDREAAAVDVDVPVTVTKHGAEGATVTGPEGTASHSGYDIGTPTDTTGAGDAFAAGFLSVWLETPDPTRALSVANACGALAAGEIGPDANLSSDRIEALRQMEDGTPR